MSNAKAFMGGHAPSVKIAKVKTENEKYIDAYKNPAYKMGALRKQAAKLEIRQLECGSLLDVGCGRGEILLLASELGFAVQGIERVPDLLRPPLIVEGDATAIPFPDKQFDHVTMFDVMEHLPVGDDEKAVRELCRVARKTVTVSIANFPSISPDNGDDLHINIRPYEEWDALLKEWAEGYTVRWRENGGTISETWRLTRD